MADIIRTIGVVFQGTDNVSASIARIEQSLRDLGSAGATGSLTGVAPGIDAIGTSATRTTSALRDLTNVFQLLAGSIVVKEFIDANVAIENFGRAMTLVSGSTEGAAESLEFVKRTSNTLGLEISSTAQNFVNLSAAAKGTALEGQGTRDIFESVSKAMALLGKSSADTGGALTAISQIISKGTVSSEELRGQLGERLPGAFQIAARAIGVTTQELGKLLEQGQVTATEFLPAFAAELNKTFGDTQYVTTFNAELNRLINSLKELAVAGGDAGAFGLLTEALRDISTGAKSTAIEIRAIGDVFSATRNFLASGGEDWDGYKAALQQAGIQAGIAASEIFNTNESLAENARLLRSGTTAAFDWSEQVNESAAETRRLFGPDLVQGASDALTALGVKTKTLEKDFIGLFDAVTRSAETSGDQLQAAFKIVLPKIDNADELATVVEGLQRKAEDGSITWQQYAKYVDQASDAFLKNSGYAGDNTKAISDQAKATKVAEENAAKLALELEKLASNERIKALEFKAEIDVERIKADASKVLAAFESINVGITSTGDVLDSVLGQFDLLATLDSSGRNALFAQLDKENSFREQSFAQQKELIAAQIEYLKAQTQNLSKGDALIKIDGAGLQPHLEAFMWEILKQIQVRVNADDGAFLLGL